MQVNKFSFQESQLEIQKWTTNNYNLYNQNCISFVRAVALSLGLRNLSENVITPPPVYFEDLIRDVHTTFGSAPDSRA